MAERKSFFGCGSVFVIFIIIAAIISARSNRPARPSAPSSVGQLAPKPSEIELELQAQRNVRARLKDSDSAVFSDMVVRRSPAVVVCGLVNSRNSFGGMSGRQRFISGSVTALEEDMAAGEMDKLWPKLC